MNLTEVQKDAEVNLETHGEISCMDSTGDTKVIWSRDNEDEVAAARDQFNSLTRKGFAAFKVVGKAGDKGEQVDEFDPKAERYILVPPMRGG
jgi:hypothetical protein